MRFTSGIDKEMTNRMQFPTYLSECYSFQHSYLLQNLNLYAGHFPACYFTKLYILHALKICLCRKCWVVSVWISHWKSHHYCLLIARILCWTAARCIWKLGDCMWGWGRKIGNQHHDGNGGCWCTNSWRSHWWPSRYSRKRLDRLSILVGLWNSVVTPQIESKILEVVFCAKEKFFYFSKHMVFHMKNLHITK
jgi:hypothetical protein